MHPLRSLDLRLDRLGQPQLIALAACATLLVGLVDYLTGFEVSLYVFYVGPVAMATWYAEWRAAIALSFLSCVCWYTADAAAGHLHSHAVLPFWNALVRCGFFLTVALLLILLRKSLRKQQHLARIDDPTGLYGKRIFKIRLEHDLVLARRHNTHSLLPIWTWMTSRLSMPHTVTLEEIVY